MTMPWPRNSSSRSSITRTTTSTILGTSTSVALALPVRVRNRPLIVSRPVQLITSHPNNIGMLLRSNIKQVTPTIRMTPTITTISTTTVSASTNTQTTNTIPVVRENTMMITATTVIINIFLLRSKSRC